MPISAISGTGTGDLLDVICSGLNKVEVPFHLLLEKLTLFIIPASESFLRNFVLGYLMIYRESGKGAWSSMLLLLLGVPFIYCFKMTELFRI